MNFLFLLLGWLLLNSSLLMANRTSHLLSSWKFHWGDAPEAKKSSFDDSEWKDVHVPHDWSIGFDFTKTNADGATAYLPGGIGWYRYKFVAPEDLKGKTAWIEFDGVYSNSEVWINGHYLGKRPYGYVPFSYKLEKHLKPGEENTIAVRADRSAYLDCRWYPGSGIYRKVHLIITDKLHIPQWGVFITTPLVEKDKARLCVNLNLKNVARAEKNALFKTTLYDSHKNQIAEKTTAFRIDAETTTDASHQFLIKDPLLWDIDRPHLYTAVTEILEGTTVLDRVETPFGIRSVKYDAKQGMFLNDRSIQLKGVCLHHAGGAVGAAVPKDVWRRRLKKLKAIGCNAIRTAHNPPSDEFLDLCDEMGFLVQDEAFDEWDYPKDKRNNYNQQREEEITKGYTAHFQEWAEEDIKAMVRRDRNHPSVVMWSLGNEIEWTYPRYKDATGYWEPDREESYYTKLPPYSEAERQSRFYSQKPGKYVLADTAQKLARWVREEDQSRAITSNLVIPSVSHFSGYTDPLDIVSYSYRQVMYEHMYESYPEKMLLASEAWTQLSEWLPVEQHDYLAGIFVWTGINYLGESKGWPRKGSNSGLLDWAGFPQPSYNFFETLWSDQPSVHLFTKKLDEAPYTWDSKTDQFTDHPERKRSWKWGWPELNRHWNYKDDEDVYIEVYSSSPQVELLLDGKSLGIKKKNDFPDQIFKWALPYQAGKLSVKGLNPDGSNLQSHLESHTKLAGLTITTDRETLKPNNEDAVHAVIQLVDQNGKPIRSAEKEIQVKVTGAIRQIGIDNGDPYSLYNFQGDTMLTDEGQILVICQAGTEEGTGTIQVWIKDTPELEATTTIAVENKK